MSLMRTFQWLLIAATAGLMIFLKWLHLGVTNYNIFLLIMLGLVASLHVPSALATITAMVSRQDWGKALGVHQTAPSVSLVLAPLLTEAFLGPLS